eukprot:m.41786 g.41786  ORF g.41786 m.41786 type:complete len:709 (-) comp12043_c0_seq1:3061-5187(-)
MSKEDHTFEVPLDEQHEGSRGDEQPQPAQQQPAQPPQQQAASSAPVPAQLPPHIGAAPGHPPAAVAAAAAPAYAPAGGAVQQWTPPQAGSFGGAPRLEKEVELVAVGVNERLPAWQRRLDAAMGRPTPLVCNFNALLSLCSTSEARLEAVCTLLQPGGIFKSPPALENIVRALEVACNTHTRALIASEIEEVHIVNSVGVTRGVKQLFLAMQGSRKVMVCAGLYERGMDGAFTQEEVQDFLEERFRVQEQALVGLFCAPDGILAQLETRLSAALGHPAPILCDLPDILDRLEDQSKRLMVARLLCHEVGVQRTLGKASQMANQFVNRYFAKTTPEPAQTPNIGYDGLAPQALYSPQVLYPLLFAIESAALDPTNRRVLSTAIKELRVQLNPGRHIVTRGLSLHRAMGEPALTPSDFWGPNPPKDCVLLYTATFEAGESGVLSSTDVNNFLESFFWCHEQTLVNHLLSVTVPHMCDRLRLCLGTPVTIEFLWNTILPSTIAFDREARTDILSTLCGSNSQIVLAPIVESIEDLCKNANARNVLSSTIEKIVIQGVAHQGSMLVSLVSPLPSPQPPSMVSLSLNDSASAPAHAPAPAPAQADEKPPQSADASAQQQPQLQPQQPQALQPGAVATPNTLLVSNALAMGTAGCVTYSGMKAALRTIFRLPNTEGTLDLSNAGRVLGHEARRLEHEFSRFGKSLQQKFFPSFS